MLNTILEKMGLSTNALVLALIAVCVVLLIMVIVVLVKMSKLTKRYEHFMRGKDAKSLEASLGSSLSKLDKVLTADAMRTRRVEEVAGNLTGSFQKVGIVKYDAFKEMGGKLSFVLALLNGNDSGFVLNVMHSREACYTYIKEIINGEAYITLGDEEREALAKAMNQD
jgi:hypothetical protein